MYAALVCTHKRGVGLAIVPALKAAEDIQKCAESLLSCASLEPQLAQLPNTQARSKIFVCGSSCFATCEGLTAENLAQLYAHLLGILGVDDSRVEMLAVNVGPGSFTGLRLGCAFANGLHFGRRRMLFAVSEPHPAMPTAAQNQHDCASNAFWGSPSPDADDPYATQMSFGDLYALLRLWQGGSAHLVDVLEPHYGREPTPVLKLKRQEGNSL